MSSGPRRPTTFVLAGGGSGGHITPLLAVAQELRKTQPNSRLVYMGERGGKFQSIAAESGLFDEYRYIFAGKLRRYHGESLWRRVSDIKTILLNFRDMIRLVIGTIEASFFMLRTRPSAILLKGGFVCVPAAIGGRLAKVPMVTHDSDAVPGLSNRIAARFARYHATAMPAKYYNYPEESVRVVGVPIDLHFRVYSAAEQKSFRSRHNIPAKAPVVLITGGSNGARRLNQSVVSCIPELLSQRPDLHIVHHIGAGNEDQYEGVSSKFTKAITRFSFSSELYSFSAIADVIITRAGATTMAEFAAQSKACIVVPHPELTGGHQLKNAQVYKDRNGAVVLQEEELRTSPGVLSGTVLDLLGDSKKRTKLGSNLADTLPKKPAAEALADLLVEVSVS